MFKFFTLFAILLCTACTSWEIPIPERWRKQPVSKPSPIVAPWVLDAPELGTIGVPFYVKLCGGSGYEPNTKLYADSKWFLGTFGSSGACSVLTVTLNTTGARILTVYNESGKLLIVTKKIIISE